MAKKENISNTTNKLETNGIAVKDATVSKDSKVAGNITDGIGNKKGKEKKEKVLSPKELEKKLASEKIARRKELREQRNKTIFEIEPELTKKRFTETQRIRKKIIINGIIFLVGAGAVVFLLTINTLYALGAIPIFAITIFNIIKSIKELKKLKNPYEIKKILILEQAKKAHNDKNTAIMSAYKEEKKRIKMLKRLPYKMLNGSAFLFSMFTIILFFFVLNIGIEATALILFCVFTVTYFLVGLIMIGVFYLVSENKQRIMMLQLEEEKNRLLLEEKLKSEAAIRNKLETERRKYEEEERLRIEEVIRAKREAEENQARIEEEQRLMEIAENDRRNLIAESKLLKHDLLPSRTKAEIAKETEVIKNEFDKKILSEIGSYINDMEIGGIEDILDKEKINTEYSLGAILPDIDISDELLDTELNNSIMHTLKKEQNIYDDSLTDFDTTDIEEAKTLIFEKAVKKSEMNHVTENINKENTSTSPSKGKPVSGKSFMVIKQMLKDG
jgi:predicted membrane channel-forming protein YqfA (hemolysin III family)